MSGPGALLGHMLQRSYAILQDLPMTVTLTQTAPGTYDTATRVYTPGAATVHTVTAILTRYRASEVEPDAILSTDRKALIRQNELAVMPSVNDTLTVAGEIWKVMSHDQDAAEGLWLLQVRKQGN